MGKKMNMLAVVPFFILGAAQAIEVEAMPALQEPQVYQQPDGTEVTATMHGDEFYHYLAGEDGSVYELKADNYLYYQTSNGVQPRSGARRVGIDQKPANVLLQEELESQGNGDEERLAFNQAVMSELGTPLSKQQNILVVMVEFDDVKLSSTEEEWANKIFGSDGKTVKNYFLEQTNERIDVTPATDDNVSNGILKVSMDMNHPDTRVGQFGFNGGELVSQVIQKITADGSFDFAKYDRNNDKFLEPDELHIMTIIAGHEKSAGAQFGQGAWGHRAGVSGQNVIGGIRYYSYTMFGEKMNAGSISSTIGVICHEFGHDIGLPDLYNTDGEGAGIGPMGLMGYGAWGAMLVPEYGFWEEEFGGTTPVGLEAYSKVRLGIPFEEVDGSVYQEKTVKARASETEPTILKIQSQNPNEYFLIENRQLQGFDKGLEKYARQSLGGLTALSGGIGIYRINTNYGKNLMNGQQLVTMLEADENILGYSNFHIGKQSNINPFYYNGLGLNGVHQPNQVARSTSPSTMLADGSYIDTEITVLSDSADEMQVLIGKSVTLEQIRLNPTSLTIEEEQATQLQAMLVPENATDIKLVWKSSNESVASVDNSGKVIGKKEGTAKIMVSNQAETVSSECTVTVKKKTVSAESVSVTPDAATLAVGQTKQLTKVITPSNATNQAVSWTSNNSAIASVDSKGLVTAKAAGTATITVTTADGGHKGSAHITVSQAKPASSIKIVNKEEPAIAYLNQPKTINVEILPQDTTQKEIVFESNNPSVVEISQTGEIVGKGFGQATIKVYVKDNPSLYDEMTVITDDHGDIAETATEVEVGKPVSGTYDRKFDFSSKETFTWGDIDFFTFTAPEDGTYILHGFAVRPDGLQDGFEFQAWVNDRTVINIFDWGFSDFSELQLKKGDVVYWKVLGTKETAPGMPSMVFVDTQVGTAYTFLIDKKENVHYGEIQLTNDRNMTAEQLSQVIKVGDQLQLKGQVANTNVADPFYSRISFASSNKNIAEVDAATGLVTFKGKGSVTITAKNYYGVFVGYSKLSETITINVN